MRRLPLRSPPRMRGKAKNRCRSCPLTRITPAYAGKSATGKETSKRWRDHPRVCGEKTLRNLHGCYLRGSPPRMRGKEKGVTFLPNIPRITPAYAGKSTPDRLFLYHLGDHPRVCGEKLPSLPSKVTQPGSPPRMRGKVKDALLDCPQRGITPAYAGKRHPTHP